MQRMYERSTCRSTDASQTGRLHVYIRVQNLAVVNVTSVGQSEGDDAEATAAAAAEKHRHFTTRLY